MMKKKGIITAGICCLATALCGLLAVQNTGSVSADVAAPTSVNDTQNHFFMETGAAVRKNADSVGIRYTAYVSQEWYNLATQDGATVKFYTAIDKVGNVDAGEAVPVEATEALSFGEYDGENEKYLGRTNLYKFTGALTYTNLEAQEWTDEHRTQAYNMQLDGQAYAVITSADTTTQTVNAVQDDNVRSMCEVADFALKGEAGGLDEYTPTEETMLSSYRTTANATAYVDSVYNTLDVGETYTGANILKVNMADANDTYTAGTFAFDNDVATANAASDAYATVYTDKGIIETNFKVCTRVIKSASDFTVFATAGTVKGYYYLANNIEDYGKVAHFKSPSSSSCFSGVFDGGGHYANLTVGTNRGLFVYLNAATIKNVQFNLKINPNVSTGDNYKNIPGLASALWSGVKITDTYIKVVDILNLNGGTFAPIANTMHKVVAFTRMVIEMPTAEYFTEKSIDESKISAMGKSVPTFNLTTGVEEADLNGNLGSEIFVISHLPLGRNIQNNYNSEPFTLYAPNTMVDTNDDGSITVDDIDATNKVTYYGQKVKTNGRQVYAYATVDALKSANHTFTSAWKSSSWDLTSGAPVFVGK